MRLFNKNLFFIIICSLGLMSCSVTGEKVEPNTYALKAADINVQLGLSYLQRGNYEIALGKLTKALEQNPKLATAHNTIALLYQRLVMLDKVEAHFKKAVELRSDYSEAHNNFGVFLCQQQQYKLAEEHFLKAIENPLYTSIAYAYENAGLCVNRIPDATLAQRYFKKALQLEPKLTKSLLQMAKLSYLNIDYDDAHSYIQRYQQLAKWTAPSLFTAIQIENKLKNGNAVASYALLLKSRFPDSDEAIKVKKGLY